MEDRPPPRPDPGLNGSTSPYRTLEPPARVGLWLGVGLAAGLLGLLLVFSLVRDRAGAVPPPILFAAGGCVVTLASVVPIAVCARSTGAPTKAVVSLVAAFVCIAFAKFTFGPSGFFSATSGHTIEMTVASPALVIVASGIGVLLLYVGTTWILAGMAVRNLVEWSAIRSRIALGSGVALLAFGAAALVVTVFLGGTNYVDFVLTSGAALVVVVALLAAAALLRGAFRSSAAQARATGNIAAYGSLVWVALAFIVLFHVLWVVYLLVLITTWPLRTVTPK